MQRLLAVFFSLAMALGGYVARAAGDTKAAELIAQARAALGGDGKLSNVQGLSCTGTVQRTMGDRQIGGEITLDLQLPDKFLRTDSISPMGDAALVVTEQGVNGDKVLRSTKTLNTPPGAIIRTPPPPAPGSEAEAQMLRNSRAELARLTLAFLAAAPRAMPIELTYAGEAESPDGKADVIDAKGPGSFAAKLFLDKASHRPLLLMYRGAAPAMAMRMQRGDGPPPPQQTVPTPSASEQVDITMFLDDYRPVDGIMLPHHITRAIDGKPNEEWTFKTIRINPAFKQDAFAAK